MEWRAIAGFVGYEVSRTGLVRSLDRRVPSSRGTRLSRGRLLKPQRLSRTGYMQVELSGAKRAVHRLVATAFLGDPPTGYVVNHKNGDKEDNRVENLEWCTPSANVQHGFRVLHPDVRPYLGKFSEDHPTSKAVVSTDLVTGEVRTYMAAMDAVREGFDSSCISRCCAGVNRWHKGRKWRFADDEEVDRIASQAGVFVPREDAA